MNKKSFFLMTIVGLLLSFFSANAQTPSKMLHHNTKTGEISIYLDGQLRPFADMNTLRAFYSGVVEQLGRVTYTDIATTGLKMGPKLIAGSGLYQVNGKPEIYIKDDLGTGNFVYRHIGDMNVFNKYGFDMNLVKKINALDKPVGSPVYVGQTAPAQRIFHNTASGRLSLYMDGSLRDFPDMNVFRAFYSGVVEQLGRTTYTSDATLKYPFGPKLQASAGLYQVNGNDAIYVLDDMGTGKMMYRHIANWNVFVAYGFDKNLIKKIASLDKPLGPPVN